MSAIIKSRASSLNKVANLPRYRHPADLVNEFQKPMLEQNKMINGELQFGKNLYGNDSYETLVKNVISTRKSYRTATTADKKVIAKEQFSHWNSYMEIKLSQLPQEYRLTDLQKNNIYEALIITKQRNQERLALPRFINFFNQFSKGFKFDIQLNPMIMMKLTYPHWGYFNTFPSLPAYRLQIHQVFHLLQELMAVGIQRDQGNSLHSSELLSFIFWKIYTRKFNTPQTPLLSTADFCTMLSYFKFNQVTPQNFQKTFSYSIQKGELENSGDSIRFDLWRQIFLDRNL